jgi:hypothetical protein
MQATLFVADDIQSLAEGKTLMVGVFTDKVVILNVPPEAIDKLSHGMPIGLGALSLMFTITDIAPGTYLGSPHITLPDGNPSPNKLAPAEFSVPKGGAANLLLKLQPFIVPAAGKYIVAVDVDGQTVSADFEVRLAPSST